MNVDRPRRPFAVMGKVFSYFLMLGFINIGGPVAQITMMYNHIVERTAADEGRFTKIMHSPLLPGPEALNGDLRRLPQRG